MGFLNRSVQRAGEPQQLPPEVEALFANYRRALPDNEGNPDFMPKLWERIEAQKRITYSFRRLASGFVSAAAAMAMLFAAALWVPTPGSNHPNSSTYVEVLDDSADDTPGIDSAV